MNREAASVQTAKLTYLAFAAIMAAWIGAWLLKIHLEQNLSWLSTGLAVSSIGQPPSCLSGSLPPCGS